jgi:FkbM family methyltransferase
MGLREWWRRWRGHDARILPSGAEALGALGGKVLARLPASASAVVRLPPLCGPPALAVVIAEVEVFNSGNIDLQLRDAAGTRKDGVFCAPGPGTHRLALFGTASAGLHLNLASDEGTARIGEVSVVGLPRAALAPERLVPQPALAPDPGWGRVYGHPASDDLVGRLRAREFDALAAPVLVSLLGGLKLWLEPGDELSRALMLSGLYEPETLLVVRSLLPTGGTFIDVGANCGIMSLFAAQCVGAGGRVEAFEPSPREFARLRANVAANDVANVTLHQTAVAEVAGTVTLRLAEEGHAGHNTIGSAFAYQGVAVAERVDVPAITLDEALAGLERCDLIKMDVEGAELRALRGAATTLARLRPHLVLEVFDAALAGHGSTVADLMAWLAAHGYEARDIDPRTGRFESPARVAPGESKNIVAVPKS